MSGSESTGRLVVSMTTRRIHRPDCRHVNGPGSSSFPYADEGAVRLLPHCRACESKAELAPKLPGSGPVTCPCGQHRGRCHFGQMHGWGLAYVNPDTGHRLERPTLHCMTCGAWCPEEV